MCTNHTNISISQYKSHKIKNLKISNLWRGNCQVGKHKISIIEHKISTTHYNKAKKTKNILCFVGVPVYANPYNRAQHTLLLMV